MCLLLPTQDSVYQVIDKSKLYEIYLVLDNHFFWC